MVKSSPLKDALVAYKDKSGVSKAKIAELAGVTPQAVTKWFRGGDIEDDALRALSEATGVPFFNIKYKALLDHGDRRYGSDYDVEVDRTMATQIFDKLPEAQREIWLAMGAWLVERYGPRGHVAFGRGKGQIERRHEARK